MAERRSQWLTFRTGLSNWKTSSQSEANQIVSLENSTEEISVSPLLHGRQMPCVGMDLFGTELIDLSTAPMYDTLQPDLLDALADEDGNPIVTEDYLFEIALG